MTARIPRAARLLLLNVFPRSARAQLRACARARCTAVCSYSDINNLCATLARAAATVADCPLACPPHPSESLSAVHAPERGGAPGRAGRIADAKLMLLRTEGVTPVRTDATGVVP